MVLSVFCRKIIQNINAEDCAEEAIHEAIDDPSFHRESIGFGHRLEVKEYRSNSGNSDQVLDYEACDGPSWRRR